MARARLASGHCTERGQLTQRGELTGASPDLEQRRDFHLGHPHGYSYEPQHLNLEEVSRKWGPTDEAVGAVATDIVEGRNNS
jgi:hypothetical protein